MVDDSCCECCWLIKEAVVQDGKGNVYIRTGTWGTPLMIQVEPSLNHDDSEIKEKEGNESSSLCDNCGQSVCYALISDTDDEALDWSE